MIHVFFATGGEGAYIKFRSLSIDSYPFRWGSQVRMSASIEVSQDIQGNILSYTSVGPLPFTRDREIPCLGNFGSCQKDLCGMFATEEMLCRFLTASGNACSCPLRKGTHEVTSIPVDIPPIPPLLSLFTNVRMR